MNKRNFLTYLIFFNPIFCIAQTKNLNYFINNAITSSPLLNENRNSILIVSIDSALIAASNKYQVSAIGNAYYAPIIRGYGYDKVITNGQQLSALVALNKQLYNKKNLSLQFADLQIQKDSLRISAAISGQDIKKNIIAQYITVYSDQLQINFNDELHSLLQKQETILKKLTQQNVYRQVDYLSFLVTVQQQNLIRRQLEIQRTNDFSLLNYLSGILDSVTSEVEEPKLTLINNFIADSSAFFLKYKIDSLRFANSRALVDLSYKPKVNLFADVGYQSSFDASPYKNSGGSFGINFSFPLYDGRQKKLQYAKLGIQERTRQKNKDFFQRQYYQQIAQLQQQLSLIQSLESSINDQIKFLETLIEANGRLLQTGDIKMTDYIQALNNYITAKNLLVQNKISSYQIINQLNYWNK